MAGYSGTPLPQKLGIKTGFKVCFLALPSDVKNALRKDLAGCEVVEADSVPLDFAMIFVQSQAEMKKHFPNLPVGWRRQGHCG
jgi:hypothetical protein